MAEADIQLARFHLGSLERLASGEQADPAALRKIRCLCWAAWHAVPDEDCGEQLMAIEVHAARLFAGGAERDWLRARIREALAAFEERLDEIEAGRLRFLAGEPSAVPVVQRSL
jgi:glutathione S-transferase